MGLITVTFSMGRSHHRCFKVPEMDSVRKITSIVVLRSRRSTFMSRLVSINTFYTKKSENRKFRSFQKKLFAIYHGRILGRAEIPGDGAYSADRISGRGWIC